MNSNSALDRIKVTVEQEAWVLQCLRDFNPANRQGI